MLTAVTAAAVGRDSVEVEIRGNVGVHVCDVRHVLHLHFGDHRLEPGRQPAVANCPLDVERQVPGGHECVHGQSHCMHGHHACVLRDLHAAGFVVFDAVLAATEAEAICRGTVALDRDPSLRRIFSPVEREARGRIVAASRIAVCRRWSGDGERGRCHWLSVVKYEPRRRRQRAGQPPCV